MRNGEKAIRKVLLLNPPFDGLYIRDQWCSHLSKGTYFRQPIDLLMLSGRLHADGYEVAALDAIAENLGPDKAQARVQQLAPDALIFLTGVDSLKDDVAFAAEAKRRGVKLAVMIGDVARDEGGKLLEDHPALDACLTDFVTHGVHAFLQGDRDEAIDILAIGGLIGGGALERAGYRLRLADGAEIRPGAQDIALCEKQPAGFARGFDHLALILLLCIGGHPGYALGMEQRKTHLEAFTHEPRFEKLPVISRFAEAFDEPIERGEGAVGRDAVFDLGEQRFLAGEFLGRLRGHIRIVSAIGGKFKVGTSGSTALVWRGISQRSVHSWLNSKMNATLRRCV